MSVRRIHTYAASFGDDLAEQLIRENTNKDDVVLDPFSGAATSLIQARILGRSAIGIDIDPIACLIASVTTEEYVAEELNELVRFECEKLVDIRELANKMVSADSLIAPGTCYSMNGHTPFIPQNDNINYWFSPIQRAVLASLIDIAKNIKNKRIRKVIYLVISSAIIHKWPNTISLARDIDHSRPHRVERNNLTVDSQLKIFIRCLRYTIEYLVNINNNNGEEERSHNYCKIIEGNTPEELTLLDPGFIDYVITSPPYFNAIDYPRAHKFSQWWLWPNKKQVNSEMYIGLRPGGKAKRNHNVSEAKKLVPDIISDMEPINKVSSPTFNKFSRYVVDMDNVIKGLGYVLKKGGVLNLIIANNVIKSVQIPVVEIIRELLARNGFGSIEIVKRDIRSTSRRYPYGIRGFHGLMNTEYILYARKL